MSTSPSMDTSSPTNLSEASLRDGCSRLACMTASKLVFIVAARTVLPDGVACRRGRRQFRSCEGCAARVEGTRERRRGGG